jgi:hypothetical protein
MAQYGRPSADTYILYWNGSSGGNIYADIDEETRSDSDYGYSQANMTGAVYVTKLSSLSDPQSSIGHIFRYTYRRSATNKNGTLVVELRQGYASEASPGTLLRTDTYTNPGSTFTAASITLSSSEADAITDYSDLYVRFNVTVNAGGGLTLQSSWAELEVPDAQGGGTTEESASAAIYKSVAATGTPDAMESGAGTAVYAAITASEQGVLQDSAAAASTKGTLTQAFLLVEETLYDFA